MTRPLLNRDEYDHPEHFDDEIREYRTSKRYVPTPLENLLFELAGHRCTVCREPWLEIHHIDELNEGGHTKYDNLIVLCPNCHTRVHSEGVPSKAELRHYKLKQEISYELPVMSRLTQAERDLITHVATLANEDRLSYSMRFHRDVEVEDVEGHDAAIQVYRKEVGFLHLQESGMTMVDLESSVGLACKPPAVSVALRVRLTGKGIKWLRYLAESGQIPST